MEAFTVRNAAKFVAKSVVQLKTSQLTEQAITDHTRFEEDDIVVTLGSGLVGWYVADKLKPVTDGIVDKAADWVVARKAKKNQDKTAE